MKGGYGSCLLAAALALPLVCRADAALVGAWELAHVAPRAMLDTVPTGVTNTKLYFTADGKVYALRPDAVSMDGADAADYSFDGKALKLSPPVGPARVFGVAFPDAATLQLTPPNAGPRTYRRLAAIDTKLEPKSLELVADGSGVVAETAYDSGDYSKTPLPERLRGVWEVVAYQNVPREQAPPYGFFNDLWTIDRERVVISRRDPPATDSVPFAYKDERFSSSAIGLGGPAGARVEWAPSFNEWGNLVLESPYCRMVLKLVTKDASKAPAVPLKVVLLNVRK